MNTGAVSTEETAAPAVLDLTLFTEAEKGEVWEAIELDQGIFDDPQRINKAWLLLPGQVARMGFSYSKAVFAAEEADRKLKTEWGAARTRAIAVLRVDLPEGKKPVLVDIENLALTDEKWLEACALAEANLRKKETWRVVMEAMRVKRDAMVSLSANLRQEIAGAIEPGFRK